MSEVVRKYYDRNADAEWRRLVQDAYHKLEFIVTMHFLDIYLPEGGLILDAGGGPGRYTVELVGTATTLCFLTSLECVLKKLRSTSRMLG